MRINSPASLSVPSSANLKMLQKREKNVEKMWKFYSRQSFYKVLAVHRRSAALQVLENSSRLDQHFIICRAYAKDFCAQLWNLKHHLKRGVHETRIPNVLEAVTPRDHLLVAKKEKEKHRSKAKISFFSDLTLACHRVRPLTFCCALANCCYEKNDKNFTYEPLFSDLTMLQAHSPSQLNFSRILWAVLKSLDAIRENKRKQSAFCFFPGKLQCNRFTFELNFHWRTEWIWNSHRTCRQFVSSSVQRR